MLTKLYLRRNFAKNAGDYLCVFVIMTLSIILINIPGVLLDAMNYGETVKKQELTGGYEVHLTNATNNDMQYLSGFTEFTATYHAGEILIKPSPNISLDEVTWKIGRVKTEHNLKFHILSYTNSGSASPEFAFAVHVVRIFFALIGAFSLYHAYSLLIETRKGTFGIIRRLGISRGDFQKLLFAELFLVYVPALIAALSFSNLLVWVFTRYFFVRSDYFTRAEYIFSPATTILLVIVSFISLITAWILVCENTVFTEREEKKKVYYRRYMFSRLSERDSAEKVVSPVSVLTKTSLFRSTAAVFPCIVLMFFCTMFIVVIFHYSNVMNDADTTNDIYIDVRRNTYDESFEDELNRKIDALRADSRLDYLYLEKGNKSFVSAFIDIEDQYRTYAKTTDGREYNHVNLRPLEEVSSPSEELVGYFAEGTDMKILQNGNTLGLYDVEHTHHLTEEEEPAFVIKIDGFTEEQAAGDFLNIFVDTETYIKITGNAPMVDYIRLGIADTANYGETFDEVYAMFSDNSAYTVVDNYRMHMEQQQNTRALFTTILILCALLAVIGMVLVWVYLSFYAIHREGEVRQLIRLGADRKTILLSDIRAGLWRAIPGYAGGMVVGFVLAAVLLYLDNATLHISTGAILLYGVLFVLTAAVFILPVFLRDRKIIRELQNIMEVEEDAGA